jgi:hypothetical protein
MLFKEFQTKIYLNYVMDEQLTSISIHFADELLKGKQKLYKCVFYCFVEALDMVLR